MATFIRHRRQHANRQTNRHTVQRKTEMRNKNSVATWTDTNFL